MPSLTLLGKAVFAAVVLVVAGLGGLYFWIKQARAPEPVACTMEAMRCPDGSWVGRTGPDCKFVCPTAATATSTTPSATSTTPSGSGIR